MILLAVAVIIYLLIGLGFLANDLSNGGQVDWFSSVLVILWIAIALFCLGSGLAKSCHRMLD